MSQTAGLWPVRIRDLIQSTGHERAPSSAFGRRYIAGVAWQDRMTKREGIVTQAGPSVTTGDQRTGLMGEGDVSRCDPGISVLIVADVRLYREGLASSPASRDHLLVIATCASRADALARVRDVGADVVVVDMATRESLELIGDLRREAVATKILAFAVEEVTSDILDCAEAGAAGYVTADASIDDLVAAIERITHEELVCSPRVAAKLFRRVSERHDQWVPGAPQASMLTSRERQRQLVWIKFARFHKSSVKHLLVHLSAMTRSIAIIGNWRAMQTSVSHPAHRLGSGRPFVHCSHLVG